MERTFPPEGGIENQVPERSLPAPAFSNMLSLELEEVGTALWRKLRVSRGKDKGWEIDDMETGGS